MAGRGTDLKISSEVKRNGGLHVIMGVFSQSIRVEDQGFCRGARQGEPGSAQVIVSLEQISVNIDSAGGLQGLQPGKLGEIQSEMLRAFAYTENRQSEPFNILVSNDRSDIQLQDGVLPIKGVETKIAGIQESSQATSYPIKGIVGSGPLTMEDGVLMKEFLGSEEFKVYLSDVGEGFVEGFVNMGKSAVDLAKIGIKYGLEPSAMIMFRMALAVDKFRAANPGKEWEVVKEGALKVAKETWREIVETATTGKGHGRALAEVVAGVGVGRGLKGFKVVGKVVDEVMDAVPDAKVCPREVGLANQITPSVEEIWKMDPRDTRKFNRKYFSRNRL